MLYQKWFKPIYEPRLQLNWYFVSKIVLSYSEKKYSTDQEKLLKFEAEGWELELYSNSNSKASKIF